MEAAGLAIGTVALLSIFKDCVDLFSMISAAEHLGNDAELLETKLDVEKLMLLQWSDRVNLLKTGDANHILNDSERSKTVSRVLSSIRSLLSEGEALEGRYGLKKSDAAKQISLGYQGSSASRMRKFLQDFSKLGLDDTIRNNEKSRTKGPAVTKRLRWIIVDKEKFNNLVNDVSYFNSRLSDLIPDVHGSLPNEASLCEAELVHLRNIGELEMIATACAKSRPAIAIAARRCMNQVRILQCLWFRWIDERRTNVQEAHFKTLRWALDPPQHFRNKWDDLKIWLQKSSGLYWLSGKAGSGKSTLMKYLLGHDRFHELLQSWASTSELVIINFFFFHLGWPEQKSQTGLLRSLLWQLLDKYPLLIESTLPNVWREAEQSSAVLTAPSAAEMKVGLLKFCKEHLVDKSLFLAVDGIDEYEGTDLDVATFMQELGSFANVKILVSSRPHPAFFAAFSQKPKMNLPDLTKGDIIAYVNATVASHPHLITLSRIDPGASEEIVDELVGKSSGVFLWVVLACRSVVEGLISFDSLTDIRARVAELPKEVEDLLEHILTKIEPRYREEATKLLRLVYINILHEGLHPIPTLALHLVCEQGLNLACTRDKKGLFPSSVSENLARCNAMEGRLRSRCYGLLEVQKANPSHPDDDFCACDGNFDNHDPMLDSHVVYMHRAVFEFLSIPDIWRRTFLRIQDNTFNSHTVLSWLWAQLGVKLDTSSKLLEMCVRHALVYAHLGNHEQCPPEVTANILYKIQLISGRSGYSPYWTRAEQSLWHCRMCRRFCDDFSLGLTLAAELGMRSVIEFVSEKGQEFYAMMPYTSEHVSHADRNFDCQMNGSSSISQRLCQAHSSEGELNATVKPLLYHALCRPLLQVLFDPAPEMERHFTELSSLDIIQYRLEQGADPNEEFIKTWARSTPNVTPWTEWMGFYDTKDTLKGDLQTEAVRITNSLLHSGAEVPPPGTDSFMQLQRIATSPRRQLSGQSQPKDWDEILEIVERRLEDTYGKSAVFKFRQSSFKYERAGRAVNRKATTPCKRSHSTATPSPSLEPSMKR